MVYGIVKRTSTQYRSSEARAARPNSKRSHLHLKSRRYRLVVKQSMVQVIKFANFLELLVQGYSD